ncbi:MAG: hypothetical protein B7Z37_03210 [Verrucomicrobia bacterium 12-59-8]|nr:MAG: hypothetical protein B7Z37_03210 [Verrucomicrobia bacterium 12-59-8]
MSKFQVNLWADSRVEVELDSVPTVTLDGEVLDARIVMWAIEYGFRQGIRDAAAAGKTDDERNSLAAKRIDALVNNTLRDVTQGNRATPVEREMRVIADREVRASLADTANAGWVATQRAKHKVGMTELREMTVKSLLKRDDTRLRAAAEANLAASPKVTLDLDDLDAA